MRLRSKELMYTPHKMTNEFASPDYFKAGEHGGIGGRGCREQFLCSPEAVSQYFYGSVYWVVLAMT